jgi:hypothetical protein
MTEFHDVVKLLLARMESHPEEFVENTGNGDIISDGKGDRWWRVLTYVEDYGTDEEQKAIQAGMREVKLRKAHEIMMDELLNGEDRRRKFQEDQEYEASLLQQMRQQQMTMAQQQVVSKYEDLTRLSRYPKSSDMEKNGIMNALRNIIK